MPPDPGLTGRAVGSPVSAAVSPHTLIVAAALAAGCVLAWWWLVGAGAADHKAMAGMAGMAAMPEEVWTPAYLLPAFGMWAIMMVAMMLPSAMPMILLFARVARGAGGGPETALFVAAYLLVWTLFSLAAALVQALFVATGIVSETTLALGSRGAAGALIVLAGLYQLSRLKEACLETCRSPLSFILRLWRHGIRGTLRLGLAHGAYCLGCCWALMLLLFAGGVMNIAWIAALALLVLMEKAAPLSLRRPLAVLLVLGGGAVALSPLP